MKEQALSAGNAYILTQDIRAILSDGVNPLVSSVNSIGDAIDRFNWEVASALSLAYARQSIVSVEEYPFYFALATFLTRTIQNEDSIGVNVDRYIKADSDVSPRCFPLSIGRMITQTGAEILATRPNTPPLQEQIDTINQALGPNRNIVFVDDGFSSPNALRPYLEIAEKNQWRIDRFIVGVCPVKRGAWAKTEEVAEQVSGKPVLSVVRVVDPAEWTNMRDFTLFGGLMIEGKKYPLLSPYIYPFSDGAKASIPAEQLLAISKKVLRANKDLISEIDACRSTPLTFTDALNAGYGLPTSTLNAYITATPQESVLEYIQKALQLL